MKTITKIAKAELMTREGYEAGDFSLEFVSLWGENEKTNKKSSSVYASFTIVDLDGTREGVHQFKMFDFGFVTPKGYKSTKMVPVTVSDWENLTVAEVLQLLPFKCEYRLNTFDPFYAENEAQRRNASAWNFIARNYLTEERWG